MIKHELASFTLKAKYRKRLTDESRIYDKKCPKCGRMEMLGKWSWSNLKYLTFRCSSPDCEYGNK